MTEIDDGIARPAGEGVDPALKLFDRTPWAIPSNAELLAEIQRIGIEHANAIGDLNTKFETVIGMVQGIAEQVQPTIDALRENPLKFLTGKMGK